MTHTPAPETAAGHAAGTAPGPRSRRRVRVVAGALALSGGLLGATAAPASAYTGGEISDQVYVGNPNYRIVSAYASGTSRHDAWLGSYKVVDDHVAARGYVGCQNFMYSSILWGFGETWLGWKSVLCPVAAPPAVIPPAPDPEPIVDPIDEPEPTRPGPRPNPIHSEVPR